MQSSRRATFRLCSACLAAAVLLAGSQALAVTNLLVNRGFEDLDSDTAFGDGWGAFGAAGFNAFFGANGHASLFPDTAGNEGGVFQAGIPATEGQEYQFDLLDTRIESAFDARLRFGLEFYAGDDTTFLGETLVEVDAAERLGLGSTDGNVFSTKATAPVGSAFVRPIIRFDMVNAAYLGQPQANSFVFTSFLSETAGMGENILKNPGFDDDSDSNGVTDDVWGRFGNVDVNDFFGGNPHASLFADTAGNTGFFFQQSILGDETQTFEFELSDVRLEENFDADLKFGLEYYGTDDATKLGEDIVTLSSPSTGDGLTFAMSATPVAGTHFVRPIFFFENVNAAYLGQDQASAFVFSTSLTEIVPLDGDYNSNGVVDAADFTVWRDALAAGATSLPNEAASPGVVDAADYNLWVSQFGQTASSGTATAVPEPAAGLLMLIASLSASARRARAD